jgi:replicative superfamily II helicase
MRLEAIGERYQRPGAWRLLPYETYPQGYRIPHRISSRLYRQRIEKLFKAGKITAMFCTSTLIEGVNLPADNLFITNYRSGRPQMTSVEFRNLIGRVGRIKFNLYGNVFFISDGNQVTEKEYVRLLREPIPEQKLSIVQELKPKLKKHVVDTLLSGSSKIEPYDTKSQKQSEEEYVMMRKFGLIL